MKAFPAPNNLPSTTTTLPICALLSYLHTTFTPTLLPWSAYKPPSPTTYIITFLLLFLLTILFKATYRIILYPHFLSPLLPIPEPPGSSWWNGHFHRIFAESSGNPLIDWIDTVPNKGLLRYKALLNNERITPTTPEVLRELLQSKCYLFQKPEILRAGPGNTLGRKGLLFTEGDVHRLQRRHISPAFAVKQLQGMVGQFLEKSKEIVGCVEREIERENERKRMEMALAMDGGTERKKGNENEDEGEWAVIDMAPWLSRVTLDIIGQCGFGYDFQSLKDDDNEVAKAYRTIFSPVSKLQQLIVASAYVMPRWFVQALMPRARQRKVNSALTLLRGLCARMVREKKREFEIGGKAGEKDLLSLITQDSPFDEEEMQSQLMTFLAAGHETTAAALSWAIYLLVLNLDVQDKLRREIQDTYPTFAALTSTTCENLDTLPYLRAVTLEMFRFYPPVPVTMREAAEDTTLAGEFVPKGTKVIVAPWAINRSKKLWGPTADKFDPGRWEWSGLAEDENKSSTTHYNFMTFLHGPRSCIGKDFARLEFKSVLAALVGMFEFRGACPGEEMKVTIKTGLTIKPGEGVKVGVRRAAGW